jgi:hypothetical protein
MLYGEFFDQVQRQIGGEWQQPRAAQGSLVCSPLRSGEIGRQMDLAAGVTRGHSDARQRFA